MSKDSNNPNAVILGNVVEGAAAVIETFITFPWKTVIAVLFILFYFPWLGLVCTT